MGTRYDLFINATQVKKLHIDQQYFNEPDQESHIGFSDNTLLLGLIIKRQGGKSVATLQEI